MAGFDPFNVEDVEKEIILRAGNTGLPHDLLLQALSAVEHSMAPQLLSWVESELPKIDEAVPLSKELRGIAAYMDDLSSVPDQLGLQPWKIGWQRASTVRAILGVMDDEAIDMNDYVKIVQSSRGAGADILALIEASPDATVCIPPKGLAISTQNFAAARTLARSMFDGSNSPSIINQRKDYVYRSERAFAAELLAPAAGVAEMLEANFSNRRIANHYGVSTKLISHQIDNQLQMI